MKSKCCKSKVIEKINNKICSNCRKILLEDEILNKVVVCQTDILPLVEHNTHHQLYPSHNSCIR
jgi:hypothetical protein